MKNKFKPEDFKRIKPEVLMRLSKKELEKHWQEADREVFGWQLMRKDLSRELEKR